MNVFYTRLVQIAESKGFKSLNDFALRGLSYESSSKLARLKNNNAKPSVDILEDISNKFQDINLHWFITGVGSMDLQNQISIVTDSNSVYQSKLIELQNELISSQRRVIELEEELRKGNAAAS